MKIVVFFGTRPELIKLFSIIKECKDSKEIELIICNTGQHKEMLTDLLNFFNVKPDYDLSAMKGNQSLASLTSRLLLKIDNLLIREARSCYRPRRHNYLYVSCTIVLLQ